MRVCITQDLTPRCAQICLGVTALIAAVYALSIPLPPRQHGEDIALLRLGLLGVLSIIVVILPSFSPQTGRSLGLLLAIGALGQLINSIVEILRSNGRISPTQTVM